jgi:hypothetical protein
MRTPRTSASPGTGRPNVVAKTRGPDAWQVLQVVLMVDGLQAVGAVMAAISPPFDPSGGPLHLLNDCTGIKVEREGEWHASKHGGPRRRVWCRIRLGIDGKRWRSGLSRSP